MALVVADCARRSGVGKRLVRSLEKLARDAGCVKMEVTSGAHREGAHAFYGELGYIEEPKRFVKVLH
jgi:GNAT superfamily N-acetyltransferase